MVYDGNGVKSSPARQCLLDWLSSLPLKVYIVSTHILILQAYFIQVSLPSMARQNVPGSDGTMLCLPFFISVQNNHMQRRQSEISRRWPYGKILFSSDWSEKLLRQETTAIFRVTFDLSGNLLFPFKSLCTIEGSKKLVKLTVTIIFPWVGKEVGSICANSCLYIMAGARVNTIDVGTNNLIWYHASVTDCWCLWITSSRRCGSAP
ncbi:unnamed protein product [Arctogadus glacialis]